MRYLFLCWVCVCLGDRLYAEQDGACCRLQLLATIPVQQKVEVEVKPLEASHIFTHDHLLVFENRIIVKITYNLYKPVKISLLSQAGEGGRGGKYTFDSVGKAGKKLPYRLRIHGKKRYVPSSGEIWAAYPYPQAPLIGHAIGLDIVIAASDIEAIKAGEYSSSLTVCIVEEK